MDENSSRQDHTEREKLSSSRERLNQFADGTNQLIYAGILAGVGAVSFLMGLFTLDFKLMGLGLAAGVVGFLSLLVCKAFNNK